MRPTIAIIYGTRPEAIKLAPVTNAARAQGKVEAKVICTGQHRELLENAEAAFTGRPDVELNLMRAGQLPSEFLARALGELDALLAELKPAMVLAQGDTATAFAAILAAFHRRIPTGHVEAGLRTWRLDAPFPEEGYRQMIDRIATRLYAPTQASADNLLKEGRTPGEVIVTGNTGIDALLQVARSNLGKNLGEARYVLATLHRREAFGAPLESVCRALRQIAELGINVVLPVHPNPNVRAVVANLLEGVAGVRLVPPLPYPDLVRTMERALCVVTDSGGLQEEAPTLGVPVLVTRETTERPEAVAAGVARLVGYDTQAIVGAVRSLDESPKRRAEMARPVSIFGDGQASVRILEDVVHTIASGQSR